MTVVSKFETLDRAVAFLCGELLKSIRIGHAEVLCSTDGKSIKRSTLIEVARLGPFLTNLCRHYVAATAIFSHDNEVSPMGAIQCRCHGPARRACTKNCLHHSDRPLVAVVLCEPDVCLNEEEKLDIVHLLQNEVHAFQVRENRLRDRYTGERLRKHQAKEHAHGRS